MSWTLDGVRLRSVLVSRLRYLGDIAMTTVVLDVLKRGDPSLKIGYLCEAAYGPLLSGHPHLNKVHLLEARRRGSDARARPGGNGHPGGDAGGSLATVASLRRRRYDLSLDLFFNPRSAWLIRLGGSRFRIGGSRSWRRRLYTHTALFPDAGLDPGFTAVASGGLADHLCRLAPLRYGESERPFLDWFAEVFAGRSLRTMVPRPVWREGAAQRAMARVGIEPASRFLLLAPGATWISKEWPEARWRELIRLLTSESGLPLAVLTPPVQGERWRGLAAAFRSGSGGVLPVLPLREALRLTARAEAVVTVDGGIMHAAVAQGRPTVAIFGPTAPEIWFPYEGSGPFKVLCGRPHCHPCDRHVCDSFVCLPDLQATEVGDAVLALLAEKERN